MIQEIEAIVKTHEKEIIELTQKLIQIQSISGDEGEIIDFLANKLEEIGFDEITIDAMGNLIGKLGNGPKILAFDGHVDTVELGELKLWKFNPLGGELSNQCIYGRGSCDQKGGLASVLIALKILKEIGIPKEMTIYYVASIQEEICEGANWKFILENLEKHPHYVILTEPSNLAISIGQRGRLDLKLTVKGLSSHGAEPDIGINAIYKMNPIIKELEELHQSLPIDLTFGKGTLAITDIKSTSVSLNAVADSCTIHIDRRLGLQDRLENAKEEIENLPSVKEAKAEIIIPDYEVKSYKNHSFKIKGYYPTWLMEESHPLVKCAKKTFAFLFKEEPKIETWRFSTNGVTTKGQYNIPTIGYGPGEERFAHTIQEHVKIEQLTKATQFFLALIIELAKI